MNKFRIPQEFKENFKDAFWWAAPVSFVADIIAILGLFTLKQQAIVNQLPNSSELNYIESRIGGFFSLSDVIVLTGIVTLFLIVSTVYLSHTKSKVRGDFWPYVWGTFLSLLLGWSYFRLWLGQHGWLWILLAVNLISIVITIALNNRNTTSDSIRFGSGGLTAFLIVTTIFLISTTGAFDILSVIAPSEYNPKTLPQDSKPNDQLNEPEETNLPKEIPNEYVSYLLVTDEWFPEIEDSFAGNVKEVNNEVVKCPQMSRQNMGQS